MLRLKEMGDKVTREGLLPKGSCTAVTEGLESCGEGSLRRWNRPYSSASGVI